MEVYIHGGDIYRNKVNKDHSVSINPHEWPDRLRRQIEGILSDMSNAYTYPDMTCERLRSDVARYTETEEERVVLGNGASELISGIMSLYRPECVLLTAPCYTGYVRAAKAFGAKIIYADTDEKKEFADFSGLLEKIRKRRGKEFEEGTDIVIVGNPTNPAGSQIPADILKELVLECEKRGVILVIDECFVELSMPYSEYKSTYKNIKGRTVIRLRALTKSFRLAGLRLGYAIFSEEKEAKRLGLMLPEWNISTPAMKVGEACLEYECALPEDKRYMSASYEFVRSERKRMSEALKAMGIRVYEGRADYLLIYSEKELYGRLLEKGILIRDCSNIEGLKKGYYRISLRNSRDNDELLKSVKEIYGKI